MKSLTTQILFSLLCFSLAQNTISTPPLKEASTATEAITPQPKFMQTETESKSSVQSLSLLMQDLKQQLTPKRRYTAEGKMCAMAFNHNGKTYVDCIKDRSPDGKIATKEWCYLQPGEVEGGKEWDFCKPDVNYDKVRHTNQLEFQKAAAYTRKVTDEISILIPGGRNLLLYFKYVLIGQDKLDYKVKLLYAEFLNLKFTIANLFSLVALWEREEVVAVKYAALLEARLAMNEKDGILIIRNMETGPSKKKEVTNAEKEEAIKTTGQAVNPHIQTQAQTETKDCEGMVGYEDDPDGDGLVGHYYDNDMWLGNHVERRDDDINFDWTGSSPMDSINPYSYSVRWQGFIRAPFTGLYQFSVECDDACSLTFNGRVVIAHKMHLPQSESLGRTNQWLDYEIWAKRSGLDSSKATSNPINLKGGSKFNIIISYSHIVIDSFEEDSAAFIRFNWKSDQMLEQVVIKLYLYSFLGQPPLRCTGLDPKMGSVKRLYENDLAFKNSEKYVLQDIPEEMIGFTCLKFNTKYYEKNIKFYINAPSVIYWGRIDYYPDPFDSDWVDTGKVCSLLVLEELRGSNALVYQVRAKASSLVRIYKKKYFPGLVDISVKIDRGINVKGVPILMWMGPDLKAGSPISCGGTNEWISDPSSKVSFDSCTTSSYKLGWDCKAGLNGQMRSAEGGQWSSNEEGSGAWMEIKFRNVYEVTKIDYLDKVDFLERNKVLEIVFNNGEKRTINITQNIYKKTNFKIDPPVQAKSMKITIKDVYASRSNGFAIKVFGVTCASHDGKIKDDNTGKDGDDDPESKSTDKAVGAKTMDLPAIFSPAPPDPIVLECTDTMDNSDKLPVVNEGDSIPLYCPQNCSRDNGKVFGKDTYAGQSRICKAAGHCQAIGPKGGYFFLVAGGSVSNLEGGEANGIMSNSKDYAAVSFTFKKFNPEKVDVTAGSKLDLKKGKFFSPIIVVDSKISKKATVLQVFEEGTDAKKFEVLYPNKDLFPCGSKIMDRDCKKAQCKVPPGKSAREIKKLRVKFAPEGYAEKGNFELDSGKNYGDNELAYGWSRYVGNNAREISNMLNTLDKDLKTFIRFPPSPKSKYCDSAPCDMVTWSAKVGSGKYKVTIQAGDPNKATKQDLKVNGEYLFDNLIIPKATLMRKTAIVEAHNQFITISSECENNCEVAISKMNVIEIERYREPNTLDLDDKEVKRDGGQKEENDSKNPLKPDVCIENCNIARKSFENCIFQENFPWISSKCGGDLAIMEINKKDATCHGRFYGQFKCARTSYPTQEQCALYCPRNACKGITCGI